MGDYYYGLDDGGDLPSIGGDCIALRPFQGKSTLED
jgi:hypothetical protein